MFPTTYGQRFDWATYDGNSVQDGFRDIVMSNGYIVVVGSSEIAPGIHLAKFAQDGNLVWDTDLGGNGFDYGQGVDVDAMGNIYVTGSTSSTDNIALPTSWQPTNHGASDAFVAKFGPNGNLIWSTYFGGEANDSGNGIAVIKMAMSSSSGGQVPTQELLPSMPIKKIDQTKTIFLWPNSIQVVRDMVHLLWQYWL